MDKYRIDKWLWAVRIYKTRSVASEEVKSGKVKINNAPAKPSSNINIDDVVTVRKGMVRYQYKVTGIIQKRVGAALAINYYIDITPPEELEKLEVKKNFHSAFREKGSGRPTKKERRDFDDWMKE